MFHPVRKLRIERGLKQIDLEKLTQIPQTRISRIERGVNKPTEDEKNRLAKAFGLAEEN